MMIPVLWRSTTGEDFVPDFGATVPLAFPALSPFTASLLQEGAAGFRSVSDGPAEPLALESVGPDVLRLEDDRTVRLVFSGPAVTGELWPLVRSALVLPLASVSAAWCPVRLDFTGYAPVCTSGAATLLRRQSPAERLSDLVQAGGCDLHIHTVASDGTDTPEELFVRVRERRLRSFAITDHDVLSSLEPMARLVAAGRAEAADPDWPVFVPGVEISVSEGRELHVLGYFPFGGHERLEAFLQEQRDARHSRNVAMVRQLRSLGYDVTLEDLAGRGQGVVGRMQAALLLTEKGYTASTHEAFEQVLGFGRPGYIERPRPSLADAVWQIRRAGGVPVLAHPAIYNWCDGGPLVSERLIVRLRDARTRGLLGVEAFHGEASRETCREISAAARYLGLIRTCGSDDHGQNKSTTTLYSRETQFLDKPEILVVGALIAREENAWLPGVDAGPVSQASPEAENDSARRFLLARRATPGHGQGQWELPGGKVEPGETPREALRREIREELAVDSEVGHLSCLLTHDYTDFRIILACHDVRLMPGSLNLNAHDRLVWASAREALQMDILAADAALFEAMATSRPEPPA